MAWVTRCSASADQPHDHADSPPAGQQQERLEDPLAEELMEAVRTAGPGPAEVVSALLAVDAVFDPALAADPTARAAITWAYTLLVDRGASDAARVLT